MGSAGGKARAVIQHTEALQRALLYENAPNFCEECKAAIQLKDNPVSQAQKRRFCSLACFWKFNGRSRQKYYENRRLSAQKLFSFICKQCKNTFEAESERLYCSNTCRTNGRNTEEYKERARVNRRKQMKVEEDVANKLRENGWEILYTSNCCDRIGIKDGKVYFLEFKRKGHEELAIGQKRLQEAAGEQFKIIVHD